MTTTDLYVALTEAQAGELATAINMDRRNDGRFDAHGLGEWPGARGWYVCVTDTLATPDNPEGRALQVQNADAWERWLAAPAPALHWRERAIQLAAEKRQEDAVRYIADLAGRRGAAVDAFRATLEGLGIDPDVVDDAIQHRPDEEETNWETFPHLQAEIDGLLFTRKPHDAVAVARRCDACGRWVTVHGSLIPAREGTHLSLGLAITGDLPWHECGRQPDDLNYVDQRNAPAAPPPPKELGERIAEALESISAILEDRLSSGNRDR